LVERPAEEAFDTGDRHHEVVDLVAAEHREMQVRIAGQDPGAFEQPSTHRLLNLHRSEFPTEMPVGDPDPGGRLFCEWYQFGRDGAGHQNRIRFGDGQLLGSDTSKRRAQVLGVLDRHRREYGYRSVGGVGGVQPATEANLDGREVGALGGEPREGQGRGQLEERRPFPFLGEDLHKCRQVGNRLSELFLGGRDAIHRDSLLDPLEVGRDEGARRVAVGDRQRGDEAGRGGLAVRPGDVDERIVAFRVPHQLEKSRYSLQSWMNSQADMGIEVFGGLLVVQDGPR